MTLRPILNQGGFSLVELLVALLVCLLLTGAVAGLMPPARAAFDTVPAAIDLHQRARAGLDLLTSVVRSSGANVDAADGLGAFAGLMPVVIPMASPEHNGNDGEFGALFVVSVVPGGAQGRLDRDQPGRSGGLTLSPVPACPHVSDVCGFRPGVVAAIVDGRGRFDVFVVAATNTTSQQLMPAAPLTMAYSEGSLVVEIDANRFALATQPDGSRSLVRELGTGVTQPVVDGVSRLGFVAWGEAGAPEVRWDGLKGWASYGPPPLSPVLLDPQNQFSPGGTCATSYVDFEPQTRLATFGERDAIVTLVPEDFQDGPWCSGDTESGRYDADLYRLRRLDVWLRAEVLSAAFRGPAGLLFGRAGSARDPIRWVPDMTVKISIALRNAS
jgi:Tfp pilus assembly protein PilW